MHLRPVLVKELTNQEVGIGRDFGFILAFRLLIKLKYFIANLKKMVIENPLFQVLRKIDLIFKDEA